MRPSCLSTPARDSRIPADKSETVSQQALTSAAHAPRRPVLDVTELPVPVLSEVMGPRLKRKKGSSLAPHKPDGDRSCSASPFAEVPGGASCPT